MFAAKALVLSLFFAGVAHVSTDVCTLDWQTTTGRDSARLELGDFNADQHHLQEKVITTIEGPLKVVFDLSVEETMGPGWVTQLSRKVQVTVNYEQTPGQSDYAPLYKREFIQVIDGRIVHFAAISSGGSYFAAYLPDIGHRARIHGELYDDVNLLTTDCHTEAR